MFIGLIMKTLNRMIILRELFSGSVGIHTFIILLMITSLNTASVVGEEFSQWNLPDKAKYRLGKGIIQKVLYSPNGEYIAVKSSIGIWIYDAHTGKTLKLFSDVHSKINLIEFSPDGSTLSYFDEFQYIHIIDTTTGKIVKSIPPYGNSITSVILSPDRNTIVTANSDYSITLWDVNTGVQITTFKGHIRTITSMVFNTDGKTLVTGSWDCSVRIWDITTGENRYTLRKHTNGVTQIHFHPNSNTFATVSNNIGNNRSKIYKWDIETGNYLGEASIPITTNATFSSDGRLIANADKRNLSLWDFQSEEKLFELTLHTKYISTFAFSPDGRTLVSGGHEELFLWDVMTGARKMSIPGHTSYLYGLAISPNNRIVATGGRDVIHLWDISTGEYKTTLYEFDEFNRAMAFSPDGQTLACDIGWSIRLWNHNQRVPIATLKGYLGNGASGYGIASIVYSPDGRYLASGSSDGTVQLWYSGRTLKGTLVGHSDGIYSIAFSPDCRYLVSGSRDNTVGFWDVENEELITTFKGHTDHVNSVAYNQKGNIVASGSKDNTVILWDVNTGKQIRQLFGHSSWVTSVAFSPDGETLASVGVTDNFIRLWDVFTGDPLPPLYGHYSRIDGISFTSDGRNFVSVSTDGTALVWDWTSINGIEEITIIPEDVNSDGVVDIQDLIYVASQFGKIGAENIADVNNDGVVDVTDIVLVAGAIMNTDSAPIGTSKSNYPLAIETVKTWLNQAQNTNNVSDKYRRGIAVLEQLLALLTPKETVLLPNYPNPFNPETWIPFQLAKPTDVSIQIYTSNGHLVRHIDLGYRPAGKYINRDVAIYWDGKNQAGEPVASGVYLCTMSAGEYTATRRMLIIK
ncbi:hypothetical protein C6497_11520 [Candidatus Poribacteria bacterium]|nr:MAG: hypothetical protein C6497_11520 [Candidatus Poribacteria bacterium]